MLRRSSNAVRRALTRERLPPLWHLATTTALIVFAACTGPTGRSLGAEVTAPLGAAETVRPYGDHLSVSAWPRGDADVERIWALAEHVLAPHDPGRSPHELVVTADTVARLRALGVPLRVEAIDVQAMIDASFDRRALPLVPHAAGKLGIFDAFFARVQTLDALERRLAELVQAAQGRAQVVPIGRSVENREIKAIRISSAPEGTDRPSAIITGTLHAREWASPMVTIGLADALVRQYAADERVKQVVDTLEIFIIPVVNPDGYVASHAGRRLQRKNMNPRCNVDLNRNWGEFWGSGVPRTNCNAETYPGEGAFSEPETQAVQRLAESRKNLRFYIDYHAAARQVMYPMCFDRSAPAGQAEDRAWTELYARVFTEVNGAAIPSRSCFGIGGGQGGCSTDWFRRRLPNGMEVELRSGGSPSGFGLPDELVVPFAEENWAGFLAVMVEVARKYGAPGAGPPADGGGSDAGTGTRADVRVADATSPTGADVATAAADRATPGSPVADGPGPAPERPVPPPADAVTTSPPPPPPAPAGDAAPAQPMGGAPGGCSCRVDQAAGEPSGAALALLLLLLARPRRLRATRSAWR